MIITAMYLIGLVEHRERTVFRIGLNPAAIIVIPVVMLVIQYFLR